MGRHRIWIGLAAVVVAMVLAAGAVVQTRHAAATSACENGTVVPDPASNPGLVADCSVLLAARDTLADTATLNWSASIPVTSWEGVEVSGSPSRVTRLTLPHRGLTGTIPAGLASLSHLERLDLYGNQLMGIIPMELGQLSNLTSLYLNSNRLTGIIPVELGQLSNLTILDLRFNKLTGIIPVELGQLSNLTHLYLNSNRLTEIIPVELGQLSNLTILDLRFNQLTGIIPVELGQLSNLTILDLRFNQLTGIIPVELGQLSNLTILDLRFNQLTGIIPVELGQLSNLTILDLRFNQLAGIIPVELGQLSNLTSLDLWYNQLTGIIPVELGQLSNLTRLYLSGNQLTGIIPVELGQLSNLTHLYLHSNQLTGIIPVELGQLSNLTRLYLSGNQLTGCVPPAIHTLYITDVAQLGLPDCAVVTIAAGAPYVPEGTAATFTITRAGGTLTEPLTVSVGVSERGAVIDGTPADSVTILANQTSEVLTVPTVDDAVAESDSVITATLMSGTLYDLDAVASAHVTVRDDDPLVSFTAPGAITEGETAWFTFTREGGISHELTVSVSVSQTGDFLSGTAPGSAVFAAGAATTPLEIPTDDDSVPEADGSIAVLLSAGTGYATTGTLDQQVVVADNDRPVVTISAVTTPIDEGAVAVFRVVATGGVIIEPFDVLVDVTESGAMLSTSPLLPRSVTLTAVGTPVDSPEGTEADTNPEPDSVITATLMSGTLYDLDAVASAHVTVRDDDPLVSFTAPGAITEGETAWFTFTREGGISHELTVSVSVSQTGDFLSGTAPGSAVFAAGAATTPLEIPTDDDSVPEADGSIAVLLSAGTGYATTGTLDQQVVVADNDRPVVTISAVTTPTDEGAVAVFRVVATGGVIIEPFDVLVDVTESGAMLSTSPLLPRSVTLTAVGTPVDSPEGTEADTNPEPDSVITATLMSGTLYDLDAVASAHVTVRDDDPLVSFTAPGAITEGETAWFTFTREGGISHELTVSVSVSQTGDFLSGTAPGSAVFAAGAATTPLEIPTDDDSVPEADGSIAVLLSAGTGYATTGTLDQQVVVADNDRPVVTISAVTTPIDEGAVAVFRVVATGGVIIEPFDVLVDVTESGAMLSTSPLLPRSVTLTAVGTPVDSPEGTEADTNPEPDSVITATLMSGTLYDLDAVASAHVTVRDDDPLVSFTAPGAITEGETAWFTFTREGGISHELTVSVSVSQTGDFLSGTAPGSAVFAAGAATTPLEIPTDDDSVPEADGSIAVLLSAGTGYATTGTLDQQVVVADNDRPVVTISAVTTPTDEGAVAVFRVVATGGVIIEPFDVLVDVTESGAMLSTSPLLPRSVTLTAVGTPVDSPEGTEADTNPEPDSVITATLMSGTLYDLDAVASAHVTVRDDDPLVSFTAPGAITEGETAWFTFTREGGISHELTVSVSVSQTGDFLSGTAPGSAVFAAGAATTPLEIPTDDDSVPEADGSIAVLLSAGTGYATTGTLDQQVVVADNDRPVVTISAVTTPIDEGAVAVFRVVATGGVIIEPFDVLVDVTESGAMLSTSPLLPRSVTLTAVGTPVDSPEGTEADTNPEPDSVITATLMSGTLYDLDAVASAHVTVRDDDPLVSFTAPDMFPEGESAVFTFKRVGGVSHELTVSVSVLPTGDFLSGPAPSSVTFAPGAASANLEIGTVDDSVPEADGRITVLLRQGADYNTMPPLLQTVAVKDNDRPVVTISAVTTPIDEGAVAVFRVVATGGVIIEPFDVLVDVTESGAMLSTSPLLPRSVTLTAVGTPVDSPEGTEADTNPEPDSVITATLMSGTLYDLDAVASADVTVRDDDPLVSFMAPDMFPEGESAVFTFKRVGGVSHELTVSVSVLPTGDFLSGPAPSSVTFAPGAASANLEIGTVDDSVPEADGRITVLLRQGADYNTMPPLLQTVAVKDNDRSTVAITAVASPVREGSAAVFRVTRTGGTVTGPIKVAVAVTETASMIDRWHAAGVRAHCCGPDLRGPADPHGAGHPGRGRQRHHGDPRAWGNV